MWRYVTRNINFIDSSFVFDTYICDFWYIQTALRMPVMKRKEDPRLFSVSSHCHVKYLIGPIKLVRCNSRKVSFVQCSVTGHTQCIVNNHVLPGSF